MMASSAPLAPPTASRRSSVAPAALAETNSASAQSDVLATLRRMDSSLFAGLHARILRHGHMHWNAQGHAFPEHALTLLRRDVVELGVVDQHAAVVHVRG